MSNSLQPHGLQPASLLYPWDSPNKNIGVACHALLQGIFLTQGSKPPLLHLPHWWAGSLPLELPGNPTMTSIYLGIPRRMSFHLTSLQSLSSERSPGVNSSTQIGGGREVGQSINNPRWPHQEHPRWLLLRKMNFNYFILNNIYVPPLILLILFPFLSSRYWDLFWGCRWMSLGHTEQRGTATPAEWIPGEN